MCQYFALMAKCINLVINPNHLQVVEELTIVFLEDKIWKKLINMPLEY